MHIAIAGNIGSGKTTLAGLLAKHMDGSRIMKMLTTIPTWTIFMRICSAGHLTCRYTFLIPASVRYLKSENLKKLSFRTELFMKMPIFSLLIFIRWVLMSTVTLVNYSSLFKNDEFTDKTAWSAAISEHLPDTVNQIQKRGRSMKVPFA